ncbi:MAG: type II toxin-antitoxin system RelE/ParE family toxin [Algisphaera sp.]
MKVQGRVAAVFVRLEKWPEVSGAKWLAADWKGYVRIRTGDYRVIFRLAEKDTLIEVVRVAHRRDVYAD